MAYGIMRVEKRQRNAVYGLQLEACRKEDDHNAGRDFDKSDIDWTKTDDNIRLIEHANWNEEITRQIHECGLKERKDSIVMIDGVYTASPEFFEGKSDAQIRDYFEDCLQFHIDNYCQGDRDRMISAVIHLDETTPHLQVASVPIIEDEKGRHLSAKMLMGGRADYRERQDRFFDQICKSRGLERGEKVQYHEKELEDGRVIMSRAEECKLHTTKREWQLANQEVEISRNWETIGKQNELKNSIDQEIQQKTSNFNAQAQQAMEQLNLQFQQMNERVELSRKELAELKATQKAMQLDAERLKESIDRTYGRMKRAVENSGEYQIEDVRESYERKIATMEKVLNYRIRDIEEIKTLTKQPASAKFHGEKVTLSRHDYDQLIKSTASYLNSKAKYNKVVEDKNAIISGANVKAADVLKAAQREAWDIQMSSLGTKARRDTAKIVRLMERDVVPGSAKMLGEIIKIGMQLEREIQEESREIER